MITVSQGDGQPLFTFCDQDGDLVLTVFSPDVDIVAPSADELLQSRKRTLFIYCDVIHPDSGEALAEPDDTFVLPNPVAAHILDVVNAHPHVYDVYTDEDGQTGVWDAEAAKQ